MDRGLLVRDLALECWPSMDRYANELEARLPSVSTPPEWRTVGGPRFLARYWRYPRRLRAYRPRFVHIADHSYAHCLASFRGIPSVVTIHDLYPLHVLAQHRRGPRALVRDALLRWVMAWARRADRWIAVSRFTATEAEHLLGIPAEHIHVVPNGVDEVFGLRPADNALAERRDAWRAACGSSASARVLLHVGNCGPRKGVETAIHALATLRAGGVEAILVQIGGRFSAGQYREIEGAGVAGCVVQESDVAESALVAAYHAADALVLPSTYEGFGLPALEAQAAGLPVVTTGAGGLADAAGDAAILAPAGDSAAFADAIARVCTDAPLRDRLIATGRARASGLTWDVSARRTAEVYDVLIENG